MPRNVISAQTPTGASSKTIKRLFAVSQNACAFSECRVPIIETSGTVTGIICHIKAHHPGGPRYDSAQTDEERHAFENLILLCARHSKVIDSEPQRYTVEVLRQMKRRHESAACGDLSPADAKKADLLFEQYRSLQINAGGHVMVQSPGGVQASTVVINNHKRRINVLPPEGSLGSSLLHKNYVQYLIDRYNDFAKEQPGRTFNHGAIYGRIKNRYRAHWSSISLNQFEDLTQYLQQSVDRTMLGSINRGKGQPNYSTFSQYLQKQESRSKR